MIVRKEEDTEQAFETYYSRLAAFMANLLNPAPDAVVLEAGCGHGALTVHLSALCHFSTYLCYDLYAGIYEKYLQAIEKKRMNLPNIIGDVRDLSFHDESVDIILSNELLCELTREGARKAVNEFYRVLKRGGTFVHGVLSPYPENRAQELVVLADAYSAEPIFPREWFSPPADELAGLLHQAGFSHIHVHYFEEVLTFKGEAAFDRIEKWVTKPEFLEKYSKEVEEYGLEYPMEQVIWAQKV